MSIKLLIITQKVDVNDPVLGFFHRWIEEFSKHCEKTTVICLSKGEYHLPSNVKVFSLGKEKELREVAGLGNSGMSVPEEQLRKAGYILNFYKYIWRERRNYDAVFIHMNQEYVLLGGLVWKLMGKKVMMWRNHSIGSFLTSIAVLLCDRVFCTSEYSYTARFKKTKIMPVGIDIDIFKKEASIRREKGWILYVGRIDPIKKVDVLIKALKILDGEGVDFRCYLYGPSSDKKYYVSMRELASPLMRDGKIVFSGSLSNEKIASVCNQYDVSVNMSAKGSFDKTIMEHMACEGISLFSNDSMKNYLGDDDYRILRFSDGDSLALSKKLKYFIGISDEERGEIGRRLRLMVEKNHSLKQLVKKLVESVPV